MPSRRESAAHALSMTEQLHQAAVTDFDRETARLLGVNATDQRCLEILFTETSGVAPGFLAERLGLTTGSVTLMLDRLEAQGYLTRSPHPTDRRRTVVRATSELATRIGDLIDPLVEDGHRTVLSHYTIAQLEIITDFLRRGVELQNRHTQRLRALPTPREHRNPRSHPTTSG